MPFLLPVIPQPTHTLAELLQLASREDLGVARNYALDERRARTGLPHDEDRGWIVMAARILLEPLRGERPAEGLVHVNFGLLVEIDRRPTRRGTLRKRIECLVPGLEVLEFLAEAVIQECERPGPPTFLLDKLLEHFDVASILGLAHARQQPVGVGVTGIDRECLAQYLFRLVETAEKHVVISQVHQVIDTFGLPVHRAPYPVRCLFLVAEHRVDRADDVEHERISVVVFDGFRQCRIGTGRLTGGHEQPGELRPRGGMLRLELRHRAECADRRPVLLELQRDQPDEKVPFDEIGLGTEQPAGTFGGLLGLARGKQGEPLPERILHPRGCPDIGSCRHRLPVHPGSSQ